jgi:hypothetical protein
MPDRDTYNLVIRPEPPKPGEPPVEIRLRQVLKLLLRGFGLRCLAVTKEPPPPVKPEEPPVEVF